MQMTNDLSYRQEVNRLVDRRLENNLVLNVKKTKELLIDLRRKQASHSPHHQSLGGGQQHQIYGGCTYLTHFISCLLPS